MGNRDFNTEILVHVSAPSKASDDAVYRNIAQAYLDFEPDRRTELSVVNNDEPRSVGSQHGAADFGLPFVAESQDLSFQSALDNRSSPPPVQQQAQHDREQPLTPARNTNGAAAQVDPLPSQISDSYPMPCQTLFKVSPARIFQTLLVSSRTSWDSSPSPKRRRTLPQSPISDLEIPSSIPEPVIEREDGRGRGNVPEESQLSGHIVPVTPFAAQHKPRGRLLEEPLPREPEHEDVHADITHVSSSFVSPVNHPFTQTTAGEARVAAPKSSARAALLPDSSHHTLEIRPPSPPVTVDDLSPDDLIPPKLAKLSKDLASRYRPQYRRDIDPLERGYWLVDFTAWPEEGLTEAWTFLTQYIGCGLAGWGVWCQRDERHGWIRLYCWGHVVKHTFLLLYLASGRRLKASGAAWTDAEGKVAVEVPGSHG